MTINQFLQNPVGKGSASGARRDVIIENLQKRYSKLYKESKKLFRLSVIKSGPNYFFVFKIPSETYYKYKFTYDVVIEFIPQGSSGLDLTLNRYAIKVFSNNPNFLFTYAYVYNQDDIIIDFLKDKVSKKALTDPPDKRNPNQSYGFEKSVYFALLYIMDKKLYTKAFLKTQETSLELVHENVLSCDEKLEQNKQMKLKEQQEKKDSLKKENALRKKKGLPPKNYKSMKRQRHRIYRSGKGHLK
jgi:hypothetical protein